MASIRHLLPFVSTMIYIFASTCKSGIEYNDPLAEGVGTDDYYHHEPEVAGTNPETVFTKALKCLNDKNIYSSCDEPYRLSQNGELNVPPEYADEYCNGACIKETHLVLECIEEVWKHFVFYNKANVGDIKETIKTGCSYGPKRGDFNVAEHIEAEEDIASKMSTSVLYGAVVMIMGWHALF